MTPRSCAIILTVFAAAALGGCAAAPDSGRAVPAPTSALALPSEELWALGDPADGWGWETGRNDADLGIGSRSGADIAHRVEVRTFDRRWNVHGRVRESSRTVTRTISEGTLRTR